MGIRDTATNGLLGVSFPTIYLLRSTLFSFTLVSFVPQLARTAAFVAYFHTASIPPAELFRLTKVLAGWGQQKDSSTDDIIHTSHAL